MKLGGLLTQHMGMNITYSGLESLIYEDLCKVIAAPLDLVMSQDTDNVSTYDRGVFQGSKEGISFATFVNKVANHLITHHQKRRKLYLKYLTSIVCSRNSGSKENFEGKWE